MDYIIIPARKNSKGFKLKNRKLFETTAATLKDYSDNVIVSTDDPYIVDLAIKYNFKYDNRPSELAQDETSIQEVLIYLSKKYKIKNNDNLILTYLTYPERTKKDIDEILGFFKNNNGKSLLCKEPISQHPYLCFYEKNNFKGERIVNHKLFRRQDYPNCFFGSHFLAIIKMSILKELDGNLFNKDYTIFFQLGLNKIDIDYSSDYLTLKTK